METFAIPSTNVAKEEEQKPLLQVEKCEEGCTSYLEDSNDHRGRKKRKYLILYIYRHPPSIV